MENGVRLSDFVKMKNETKGIEKGEIDFREGSKVKNVRKERTVTENGKKTYFFNRTD